MKLSSSPRVRYSPGERRVFSFLRGKEAPRDTEKLISLHYDGSRPPFHGRRVVTGLLSSLARKAELNGEPFQVCSTGRMGPVSMAYWLEPRRVRSRGDRKRVLLTPSLRYARQ